MQLNIELASPDNFIPASDDWREKSIFIQTIGAINYYHYDLNLQSLAKIERGYTQDLEDVKSYVSSNLVTKESLLNQFNTIEPKIIRYPSIDASEFKKKVNEFILSLG